MQIRALPIAIGLAPLLVSTSVLAAGDLERGARAFGACAACHTLEPGRHVTGPSLAGVWGRKAGAAEGFARFSAALRNSKIVWSESTLDAWLANPEKSVPGNYMLFGGIGDAKVRADLVAYLRAVSEGKAPPARRAAALPDLKNAPRNAVVTALRHCGDTYFVTNGEGTTLPFWEFNLRFKTDSGASGPAPGRPVLVGQGMQGDRAQVVFARPEEVSSFIRRECPGS
ncbi:MAG: c-type cytochrome [Steroidobacteraceae bacterium]